MDIEDNTVVIDGKEWVKDIPDMDDLELLVAPWENAAFKRDLQKKIRALPAGLRPDGAVDPVAYERCVGMAMVKTILFDWRNMKAGGQEKAFDKEYAQSLLTDPTKQPFKDAVVVASKRVQRGVKEEEKALEKNSSSTSLGSETSAQTPTA